MLLPRYGALRGLKAAAASSSAAPIETSTVWRLHVRGRLTSLWRFLREGWRMPLRRPMVIAAAAIPASPVASSAFLRIPSVPAPTAATPAPGPLPLLGSGICVASGWIVLSLLTG